MRSELDIVRDVSARLEKGGIAFMLTGSMAMNFYAQPRMTRDIDIVVELVPAQAQLIVRLLSPDYYVAREAVDGSLAHRSMFNAIHQETIVKVDFIIRKDTEYRSVEFLRRRRVKLDGFETWIVSKEDLIISKLDWAKESHSEFQLRDVRNLMSTGCDEPYLTRWTQELGLQALLQECSHE